MLIGLAVAASVILAQASPTAAEKPISPLDCRQVLANAAVPGRSSLCQALDASRAGNAATDPEQKRQQLTRAADLLSRATMALCADIGRRPARPSEANPGGTISD
jgi:hypothetical protein